MKKLLGLKAGFTLAEVLITLGVIGVVAAMTIPVLMNAIQEQQFKTAYKKAFSVASQAIMQASNDNNLVFRPEYGDIPSRIANFAAFKSYFKFVKECNGSNNIECWATGDMYAQNYPTNIALAFVDNSGMAWSILNSTGSVGDSILVDTNGFASPNKYGQDRFVLQLVASDGNYSIGIPIKTAPLSDYTSYSLNYCPSGNNHPCYYTKWLYN